MVQDLKPPPPGVTPWPMSMIPKGMPPVGVWLPPVIMLFSMSDQMETSSLVFALVCMAIALCVPRARTSPRHAGPKRALSSLTARCPNARLLLCRYFGRGLVDKSEAWMRRKLDLPQKGDEASAVTKDGKPKNATKKQN